MDKDFGELVYNSGKNHKGVHLLRLEDQTGQAKVYVLSEILKLYSEELEGHFSVYQNGKLINPQISVATVFNLKVVVSIRFGRYSQIMSIVVTDFAVKPFMLYDEDVDFNNLFINIQRLKTSKIVGKKTYWKVQYEGAIVQYE